MPSRQKGLYANIHAKQARIAHGSGEHMRPPGAAGAPSDAAFEKAAGGQKSKATKSARKTSAKKTGAGR